MSERCPECRGTVTHKMDCSHAALVRAEINTRHHWQYTLVDRRGGKWRMSEQGRWVRDDRPLPPEGV